MNRISLSKQLAFVLFLVALAPGMAQSQTVAGGCKEVPGFILKVTEVETMVNGSTGPTRERKTCEPDPRYDSKFANCKAALEKINENKQSPNSNSISRVLFNNGFFP